MAPQHRSLDPNHDPRWPRGQGRLAASRAAALFALALLLALPGHAPRAREASAAPAAQQALPKVLLPALPTYGLIGSDVGLSASFVNAGSPGALGYGPFLDLVIDRRGVDGNDPAPGTTGPALACDGLELVAGSTGLAGAPATDVVSFGGGDDCTTKPVTYAHPFLPGGYTVTVPQGHQLVSVRLPVGSYASGAPPLGIELLGHIHELADEGVPLRIYARAGFIHGDSPTGTTPTLSHDGDVWADGWDYAEVIPLVMLTDKRYLGPEDEAALGPSHKDAYPLRYELSVLIAPGQTVEDLVLTDHLPEEMVFDGVHSHTPGCTATGPPVTPAAGATVTLECPQATGLVTLSFWFHMGLLDASGQPVVDLSTCDSTVSIDDIEAAGLWMPLDPRDRTPLPPQSPQPQPISVDATPEDHKLQNKCLAVQKSVEVAVDHGAPGPTPGDLLDYSLAFQITDYAYVGDIVLEDFLSDGQTFVDANVNPVLRVKDGTLAAPLEIVWPWSDFAPVADPGRACRAGYPDDGTPFELVGGHALSFDVSALLEAQSGTGSATIAQGVLAGAATFHGQGEPAWGELRFRVRIDQSYAHPQPPPPAVPGNAAVDKHDPLCNEVLLRAQRVDQGEIPGVFTGTGVWAQDDSRAAIQIVPGSLEKAVIGRNGFPDELLPCPDDPKVYCFSPGDTITFEIVKQIPSGDAEDVVIEDWLPSPSLDATALGAWLQTSPPKPGLCANAPANPDYPPTGQACWYTTPTQLSTSDPSLPSGGPLAGNGVRVDFGDLGGPGIAERALHLLVTLEVTDEPYADGLKQVNIARECEANTLGKVYCDVFAAEFQASAPRLGIRKGVVWTSKDGLPPPVEPPLYDNGWVKGPITDAPPSTGWPLGSTDLGGPPISLPDADVIHGLDAGDRVRFAIVVENMGHAVDGAFEVTIQDVLPPQLVAPAVLGLWWGDGTPIPTTGSLQDLFGAAGLTLQDAGADGSLSAFHPTDGANLAVLLVEAELAPGVAAGCYENVAHLRRFTNQPGGDDYVAAGLAHNASDAAIVCVRPWARKSLSRTSEAHTSDLEDGSQGEPRPVAIGEIVEYEVFVEVPEGTMTGLTVSDLLPSDLAYLPGSATVTQVDAGVSGVAPGAQPSVSGGPFSCLFGAQPPSFHFAALGNAGTGTANAPKGFRFTFDVQVCNTTGNDAGDLKPNDLTVEVAGQLPFHAPSVVVKVVEPTLALTKTFGAPAPWPPAQGDVVPYELQLTNAGPVTAFEVDLDDLLPAGLKLVGSPVLIDDPPGCATGLQQSGPLSGTMAALPPGCSVLLSFEAEILDEDCDALENLARATWCSLPGCQGTRASTSQDPTFNETGSETAGAPGAADGARDGSDGTTAAEDGEPNDHVLEQLLPLCGRVCGVKCEDKNRNGLCDPGEPRLEGWTVYVENGGVTTTAVTAGPPVDPDEDPPLGGYCFDVMPGWTVVGEILDPQDVADGWVQTGPLPVPPGTHGLDVEYADDWQTLDFANFKPLTCEGVIRGVKFEDLDGDGVWDAPGEKGLSGWTITATPVGGGPSVSTTTDANGAYQLTLPGPGAYTIDELDQAGWVQTHPAPPRRYYVVIECDQDGTPLPLEAHIEGSPVGVPAHELHFGNRKAIDCPPSKTPWMIRRLVAWGDALTGAIGGIPASASPVWVNEDLQQVDQGSFHTVALTAAGEVKAWGGPPTSPQAPSGAPFLQVHAGRGFSVALDAAGAIHVWRDAAFNAQVMSLPLPGCSGSTPYCVTTPGQPGDTFVALDAGLQAVAAIDLSGALHTWGTDNGYGQLPGTPGSTPGEHVLAGSFRAVSTDGFVTLAADASAIHGWGDNQYLHLPGTCAKTATSCSRAGDFVQVERAGTHSLALDANGAIWAWGDGSYVTPPGGAFDAPYLGATGSGFKDIAGGSFHSLAMRPDGQLEAWGHFWDPNVPITPPAGIFYDIAGGGIDFSHAAGLRCPVRPHLPSTTGQIFLPAAAKGLFSPAPGPRPTPSPSASPSPLPTRAPTWTPAPPPSPTPSPEASPTRATPRPSATPTPEASATATPSPSPSPTTAPPPAITGVIRSERGCAEDPAEVRYAQGETVPIQLRIDGARATVRVMYQWPEGGQERQIDGGTIDPGLTYSVSPPLVIPAEAPTGVRRISLQLDEGGGWRELARCGFTVVSGGGDPPTATPEPPGSACMPLSELPGLVAWWRLDEQRGELATDAIAEPTLNHGLIHGLPGWGPGMVGGALRFDGATTYVDVADDASLDFAASPRGDFTLDAWIKLPPGADTNGVHVAMTKQAGAGAPGYQLYLWNGEPGLQLADAGGFSNFGSGVAIPKDDRWHLLAVTVDRDRADGGRFYLDGQLIGTPFDPTRHPGSLENDAPLRIGGLSFQASSNLLDAWLDEVEVLRGALSAQAVARLERARGAGKCAPDGGPAPTPGPTVPPLSSGAMPSPR